MPKQSLVINRFDGGINSHSNQKDIPDNSLVKAENIMVDKHGKIRVMGTSEDAQFDTLTGTTYPGYGIFSFQSDYDNPNTSTNLFATNGDFNISGTNAEKHSRTSNHTSNPFTTWEVYGGYTDDSNPGTFTGWKFQSQHTTTTTNHPSGNAGSGWHLVEGSDKMVCNKTSNGNRHNLLYRNLGSNAIGKTFKIVATVATSSAHSDNKFRFWTHNGINSVTSTFYSDYIAATSSTEYSAIFQIGEGSNGNIGIAANASTNVNFDVTQVAVYQMPSLLDTKYLVMQDRNELDFRDLTNNTWRTGLVDLALDAANYPSVDTKPVYYVADGIIRVIDSNFNNSNTVSKWYGIINRTNFGDTSGNAQFLEWLSADQKLYPPSATTHGAGEDHNPGKASGTSGIVENDAGSTDIFDDGVATDGIKFHYGLDTDSTDANNGTWQGTFKFYISYLYDLEKQESGLFNIGDTITNTDSDRALICAFSVDYHDGSSLYRFNKRITGARVYYTDSDDSDGIYYQLMDVDFVQGCKKYDDLNYTAWSSTTTAGQNAECPSSSVSDTGGGQSNFRFLHPPKVLTYQALNGYDADEDTIFKYKTAVIANRRCYIGNVGKLDKSNEANNIIEKFNDRIIKSPVNKFDTFPEGNFLDVTVNDGDEIIRLETFADRLLQFKKQKLFIINISQDIEFLESEHNYMGIDHHAAVTKTELGVIWTNKRGCYIYNGSNIQNLIDLKISQQKWSEFMTNSGMIGYIPDKKQIAVLQSPTSTSGNIYMYDFLTSSWTFGNNILSTGSKTNITTSFDGKMLFGQYTAGTNDVDISVGTNYGGVASSNDTGVAPTAEIVLFTDSRWGFTNYSAVSWRLVLARSFHGSNVTFDSNLAPTNNTADELTDVLPASIFATVFDSDADSEDITPPNASIAINALATAVNANSSSTYWEAEQIGSSLKLTYTGNTSYWDESAQGTGIGNSSAYPAAKALVFLVKIGSTVYKIYTNPINASMVMSDTSGTAYTAAPGWTEILFTSIPLTTIGTSIVTQVTQMSFLNMPGSSAANLSGVTFDINLKQFNSSGDIVKDSTSSFTTGEDLTDYIDEGGFDTSVADSLDTNQELATAIRSIMASNPDFSNLTFGAVTNSSTADNLASENIYYFNITGPSDGTRFEITRNIFSGRRISQFTNDTNLNSFIKFITKDIDFGQPGTKKTVYKVYVTFKTMDSDFSMTQSYTKFYYQTNGTNIENNKKDFDFSKSINYGPSTYGLKFDESIDEITTITLTKSGGLNSTDITSTNVDVSDVTNVKKGDAIKINSEVMLVTNVDVANNRLNLLRRYQSGQSTHDENAVIYIYPKTKSYVAELIPSSPIKNIYSIQLMAESAAGTPAKFEIEDITIVYRMKSTR